MGWLLDVLCVCVLCFAFDCSFFFFFFFGGGGGGGLYVCLFAFFRELRVRKTPALLSKRTVFFLLTAVLKQELLHLCFHC